MKKYYTHTHCYIHTHNLTHISNTESNLPLNGSQYQILLNQITLHLLAVLMCGVQENHCEMRISLNQKPNSSRDFGFQAVWDSTGARVTSIQAGTITHSQGKRLQIMENI